MAAKVEEVFSVSGKVVAVTGAAGVIYAAVSRALAANGAKVALLDLLGEKVAALAEEIRAAGGEAIGIECNVLEGESIEAALQAVVEAFGTCDALVNGAGGNRKGATVPPDGQFTSLPPEELEAVFRLNYLGTVLPSQIFADYFARRGDGCIINTSSMSALAPLTNVGGYSNALSLESARRRGVNYAEWLSTRLNRLIVPLLALVICWAAISAVMHLLGADQNTIVFASQASLIPTWFLAIYIMAVILAPASYRFWKRFGFISLLAFVLMALLIDAAFFIAPNRSSSSLSE